MIELFAVTYLQHGMWVGPDDALMGRQALAYCLAQVAQLPGVSTVKVAQLHEENAEDYGFDSAYFEGYDYMGC